MKKLLKIFVIFKWFDFFGVVLVVGIVIVFGYFNFCFDKFVDWGLWIVFVFFGLIFVINVGIFMLFICFMGKLSKWGNYFGIVNIILFGVIDYIFGNKAVIIIYFVIFFIYIFVIKKWEVL